MSALLKEWLEEEAYFENILKKQEPDEEFPAFSVEEVEIYMDGGDVSFKYGYGKKKICDRFRLYIPLDFTPDSLMQSLYLTLQPRIFYYLFDRHLAHDSSFAPDLPDRSRVLFFFIRAIWLESPYFFMDFVEVNAMFFQNMLQEVLDHLGWDLNEIA